MLRNPSGNQACGDKGAFCLGRNVVISASVSEHRGSLILGFLGRKVMTNLDSILKSRDITLSTKVRLVKAMVFPVIMFGYESWTIEKAEH